jgi:hypothetical protein
MLIRFSVAMPMSGFGELYRIASCESAVLQGHGDRKALDPEYRRSTLNTHHGPLVEASAATRRRETVSMLTDSESVPVRRKRAGTFFSKLDSSIKAVRSR